MDGVEVIDPQALWQSQMLGFLFQATLQTIPSSPLFKPWAFLQMQSLVMTKIYAVTR